VVSSDTHQMSSAFSDGLLTSKQTDLLDELTACTSTTTAVCPSDDLKSPTQSSGSEYEAFFWHWRQLRLRHSVLEQKGKHARWEWINQMQNICADTRKELDALLAHVDELDEQRQAVVRKTTALHEQCEQMVQDQEQLNTSAEAIDERLNMFDRVKDVEGFLEKRNAADPEFSSVLDQLDGSIAFLETHYDFAQSQGYLSQFEHLRNKACMLIRSAVQKSLEKSTSQVEQQFRDKSREGTIETQLFYTRFRAAALDYKPLLSLLHKRWDVHETYMSTLEELEGFYIHLRIRLVLNPVTAHLQSVLRKDLLVNQLAPATRQASTYILDICHFESQCFEAYFELRQPQDALRSLLEALADTFYKTVRPIVLACDSIDSLREMADCLQMDVLQPRQQSSRSELVPVLAVAFRLHKDVQEKLIFRVQTYVRDEIKGYQPIGSDLDYPSILFAAGPRSSPTADDSVRSTAEFQCGWYPTMRRSLGILSKIYHVLELSTFQGLAQEAVDICIASLKHAAQVLAQRALPDRQHALGPLVQMMDSQLFLVKHLLILREQVAAFECDLVVNEKYFNFSNLWDALSLKLPDGLLGILKPKLHQSQVDSKKDIEAELKSACESLITNLTAHITQPMAALNTQISDFLAAPGGDRDKLKDQPFMSLERLKDIIIAFLSNVRQRVPFVAAHIRLYSTTAGSAPTGDSNSGMQSTASILFKPVQMRLVDTWGRLEGLLEERSMTTEELDRLGFIRPEALKGEVTSLFSAMMEAPWGEVVNTVSQVPRVVSGVSSSSAETNNATIQPVPQSGTVPSEAVVNDAAKTVAQGLPSDSSSNPVAPPFHPPPRTNPQVTIEEANAGMPPMPPPGPPPADAQRPPDLAPSQPRALV